MLQYTVASDSAQKVETPLVRLQMAVRESAVTHGGKQSTSLVNFELSKAELGTLVNNLRDIKLKSEREV